MRFLEPDEAAPSCQVKICGLRSGSDARRCAALGADALGFNFWPSSHRFLPPAEARSWLRDLPGQPARIGVFVDAAAEEMLDLLHAGCLDAVQLHGSESPRLCQTIREAGFPVLKAIGLQNHRSLLEIQRFADARVSGLLIDAYAPGFHGGTGKTVDWNLAAEAVASCSGLPVILAGGLHPGNVAEAIAAVRPHAVDVASGVELEPGLKDWEAMEKFVKRAHSALPWLGEIAK
ncbi:MAG TPA: phosphoribosylanthranilate isomerase [Verrucomicrobiales bacterium]|nr:phosphoribosylanthranilate isomerase [Verrucomicrobiales bacterium]